MLVQMNLISGYGKGISEMSLISVALMGVEGLVLT